MKILAINGSHRGKRGYTEFLINKVFEGAISAGAECEKIVLAELDVKRCTGCFFCQKEEHLLSCIYDGKDDTRAIFDKMKWADIIIFATPIYVFNMSSLLLNLFDRFPATCNAFDFKISESGLFFHNIDKEISSKPFVTIICQDNLENETHKNVISYFKTYSKFMDSPYIGSLVRKSGHIAKHGKDEKIFEKYPILKDIYEAFVQAGKEIALNGKISNSTQKRANKNLIDVPFFVKPLMKFKGFRKKTEVKIKGMMK